MLDNHSKTINQLISRIETLENPPFVTISSGSCINEISRSECENYSNQVGFPFSVFDNSANPPGCFHHAENINNDTDDTVWFNVSYGIECSETKKCVCKGS